MPSYHAIFKILKSLYILLWKMEVILPYRVIEVTGNALHIFPWPSFRWPAVPVHVYGFLSVSG